MAAEKARLTRVARLLITVEGVFCLVLGVAGIIVAARSVQPTVLVGDFKLGLPQFTILAAVAPDQR